MYNVKIVSKTTHIETEGIYGNIIEVPKASVVVLGIQYKDVAKITKDGSDAVVQLKSGDQIVLKNFFINENYDTENSVMMFMDGPDSLVWAQFIDESGFVLDQVLYGQIESFEPFLYGESGDFTLLPWLFPLVTGMAIGSLAESSESSTVYTQVEDSVKPTQPEAPKGLVDENGQVIGKTGEETITQDNTPSILIGTPKEGETVKLLVDGQEVEAIYVDNGDGTSTLTPVEALTEGKHQIGTIVVDEAGNISEVSDPIQIAVEKAPVNESVDQEFLSSFTNSTIDLGVDGGSDTIAMILHDANEKESGLDTVINFHLGDVNTDEQADIINVHDLLTAENESVDFDQNNIDLDVLSKYLTVESNGTDTTVAVDRTGQGEFNDMLVLKGVDTDLTELLFNNQLVI